MCVGGEAQTKTKPNRSTEINDVFFFSFLSLHTRPPFRAAHSHTHAEGTPGVASLSVPNPPPRRATRASPARTDVCTSETQNTRPSTSPPPMPPKKKGGKKGKAADWGDSGDDVDPLAAAPPPASSDDNSAPPPPPSPPRQSQESRQEGDDHGRRVCAAGRGGGRGRRRWRVARAV